MKAVRASAWYQVGRLATWLAAGLMLASGVVAYAQVPGVEHVVINDAAATVAYIFGLEPPRCWIARPVVEAFATPVRH
jgi:hypothetical protein